MPAPDDHDLPPWLIERHRETTNHIFRTNFGSGYPQGSIMATPLVDHIRQLLQASGEPMTTVQIMDELPPGFSIDAVHAVCCDRKRAGEFFAEVIEGKLAYRPVRRVAGREESSAARAGEASDGVEAEATPVEPEGCASVGSRP